MVLCFVSSSGLSVLHPSFLPLPPFSCAHPLVSQSRKKQRETHFAAHLSQGEGQESSFFVCFQPFFFSIRSLLSPANLPQKKMLLGLKKKKKKKKKKNRAIGFEKDKREEQARWNRSEK
jgi:hypothetical protein